MKFVIFKSFYHIYVLLLIRDCAQSQSCYKAKKKKYQTKNWLIYRYGWNSVFPYIFKRWKAKGEVVYFIRRDEDPKFKIENHSNV